MARARFEYVPSVLDGLIQEANCDLREFAGHAGVSERHLHNIFNGTTTLARFRTKKKIQDALERRGISRKKSDAAFREV